MNLEFQSLCAKAKAAIERKIGGSEKIQELVLDYALNEWVKQGRELHKEKQTACAFCGSEISSDRWNALEKHFDEETSQLEQEITKLIEEINTHKTTVVDGFKVSKDLFYAKFHPPIEKVFALQKAAAALYCKQLESLTQQLEKRKQAITVDFAFVSPEDVSADIEAVFTKLTEICMQSNAYTNELEDTKKATQKTLRLHEVRTFVDTVNYVTEKGLIATLELAKNNSETATQETQKKIKEKKESIEDLKRRMNDEEKGAIKVNEYLNHFFGHQLLTLKATTSESSGTKQVHFEIMRGNQQAFNLSEGECSLIAFCYFMAKLDDVNTSGKKSIVWVDDPISSLDGNHIFFVYSLLQAEIVDRKKFEQLFISTHNLEFLKYLKKINGKNEQDKPYHKEWFIVERANDAATIKPMPKYLREYITEFNYLFHQIYKCTNMVVGDDNYADFYNFGNNARKFLEIYLYYKQLDNSEEAMVSFFDGKIPASLTNRINNEQSHLFGSFERGAMPVDIPEIQSCAKQICQRLEKIDKEQYDSLLRSIGVTLSNPAQI